MWENLSMGDFRCDASLVCEYRGEHLIIINQSPTPYDRYAEYVIREPIEQVLRNLCEE